MGGIREGCQGEADLGEHGGFEYAPTHRTAFLAEESAHAKVRRQEGAARHVSRKHSSLGDEISQVL